MARNKYPEETRTKILYTARRLFYEKGYDNTTIQDIINGLGGLTKGVIYHSFKSKRHIFECIIESLGVSEGAITTNYPKELTEFISLTVNIWLGLNIVRYSREELKNKMYFCNMLFSASTYR